MFYGFGLMQLHAEVSTGMLFSAWLSLITYARWYKRNGEASREEKGTPLFPASRMTLSGGTKGQTADTTNSGFGKGCRDR
jgi:hypothetical protein